MAAKKLTKNQLWVLKALRDTTGETLSELAELDSYPGPKKHASAWLRQRTEEAIKAMGMPRTGDNQTPSPMEVAKYAAANGWLDEVVED